MEKLTARGSFHAGHRQLGYDGRCVHVHGHTWRGVFVVKAQRFPRLERLDMSVDFGALKDIFKFLDHKMLISDQDATFLDSQIFDPAGVVIMPGKNPSVENVALYCMNKAVEVIAKSFPAQGIEYQIEVTIQETDNNIFALEQTVTV